MKTIYVHLGSGWFGIRTKDGGFIIINSETGKKISLTSLEAKRFVDLYTQAELDNK